MDAPCKIQGSIHVFRLINYMCPGKWVHIIISLPFLFLLFRARPSIYAYYLRATRMAAIIAGDFQRDWPLSDTSLSLL